VSSVSNRGLNAYARIVVRIAQVSIWTSFPAIRISCSIGVRGTQYIVVLVVLACLCPNVDLTLRFAGFTSEFHKELSEVGTSFKERSWFS
jgi:hypothetical protein